MISLTGIQQNLNRPFSYSIAAWLLAYYDDPELWNQDDRLTLLQAIQQASEAFQSALQLSLSPAAIARNDRFDPRFRSEEDGISRGVSVSPYTMISLYTDYEVLKEALAHIGYNLSINLVESREEADYVYTCSQMTNFLQLPLLQRVCQFPYESAFVRKDLLPLTVRKYCYQYGSPPAWWLPCYDLSTEFHLFYCDYQKRLQLSGDHTPNRWIIKPAQGTRGQGHSILQDQQDNDDSGEQHGGLHRAARLSPLLPPDTLTKTDRRAISSSQEAEAATYDRVAQLLVDHPLLVDDCKFDMRYFVFVRSFRPSFEAYLHSFHYARLANKPYSISSLGDEEVTLTVLAYSEDQSKADKQRRINCHDLPSALDLQYGEGAVNYSELQSRVLQLLKELFGGGGAEIGGPWPSSSAYYSVDIIFDGADMNQVQPKLLEVNFMGDWHGVESAVREEGEYLQWVIDLLHVLVISGPPSTAATVKQEDNCSIGLLSSNPRLIPLHE